MSDVLSIYVPSFFNMLGMSIVSPIIAIYAKSFGVSLAVASLAITMNALGRFITDIPAGVAADKFGRRPCMLVGSVMVMVMAFMNASATGFAEFLVYRFLQGVGSSLWMTSRQTLLADILKPEERGRVMGYFQAFMLIGQSAGPVFGGWAAAIWDLRAPFYVYSVMGLLTVIFTYFLIHEPKWIVRKLGEEHFPKANDAKRLLKNTTFAVASIATFIVFFQRSGVKTNLLPIYATDELSMDSAAIGTILGYSTIAQLLITVPAGYAIDLLGRKPVIISNLILMAAANLAFVYAKDYWSVSLAAVVLGLASGGAGQAPLALATDATYHERRGLSMGFYRLVGDVGGMLGPVMLSSIADFYGLHLPFWVMTGMLIMSALIILVFAKEIIDVKENRAKVLNKRGLLS